MKRCSSVLAVLATFAGIASAQSSVTIFGTIDLAGRYVKADGQSRRLSEASDGLNPSQLGFKGSEDLGDGLRAGFSLISTLIPDTGTTAPKFWNRTAIVSLSSRLGEIRLGRDYTPSFYALSVFDVFGFTGLGASANPRQLYGGTRMDNSIQYFLPPNIGGFYGHAMVSAAEGGTTADRPGRYVGGRVGYASGPFNLVVAAGHQRFALPIAIGNTSLSIVRVTAVPGDTQKTYNIAGSWDFGFAKLMGYHDRDTVHGFREDMSSISAAIPFGLSEVHVGYDRSKLKDLTGKSTSVDQIKASYVYNLSKRTAMYATASRLDNKDGTRLTLPGAAG